MPQNEDLNPESTEDQPIEGEEAAAGGGEADGAAGAAGQGAGAPGQVTQEQFQQLQAQLGHLQQSNLVLQQALAQTQQQAPQQAAPQRITDEQVQKLIDEGKGVEAMRLLAAEQANERVSALEQTGVASLQSLTKQVALQKLSHYEQYQDEIEGYLQQLAQQAPDALLNPQVYELAHNYVVGQHVDDLVEAKVQEELRRRQQAPVGDIGPAGRVTTHGQGGGKIPSPTELFGPEIEQTLAQKGGADNWAQSLGYQNWADYVQKTEVEGNA